MHTSKFQIAGYEGDVLVFHNGDWSVSLVPIDIMEFFTIASPRTP
jgi:hypothetical protein